MKMKVDGMFRRLGMLFSSTAGKVNRGLPHPGHTEPILGLGRNMTTGEWSAGERIVVSDVFFFFFFEGLYFLRKH